MTGILLIDILLIGAIVFFSSVMIYAIGFILGKW